MGTVGDGRQVLGKKDGGTAAGKMYLLKHVSLNKVRSVLRGLEVHHPIQM